MKDKSMINMAGTSMGSGVKMCGSQVGKHMKMGGPKMMGGDKKKGFRESFAENRDAGKKEFEYEGKMYNTQTAEETAKKLSDSDLASARETSFRNHKLAGFNSKSKGEIYESNTNELLYRRGDKLEKMGLDPNKYSDRMKGNFLGSAMAAKRPNRLKP